MSFVVYAFACLLVGLYVFTWIMSWMFAESAVFAWARKNQMAPLAFEFPGSGRSPDLGQGRDQRLGRLTVRKEGETYKLWVA